MRYTLFMHTDLTSLASLLGISSDRLARELAAPSVSDPYAGLSPEDRAAFEKDMKDMAVERTDADIDAMAAFFGAV